MTTAQIAALAADPTKDRIFYATDTFTTYFVGKGKPGSTLEVHTTPGKKATAATAAELAAATAAQRQAVRAALDPESGNWIGFYDDFSRTDIWPDGRELEDGVTLPIYGTAWKFKPNDGSPPVNTKPFVLNGSLQHRPRAQGYLAAHAFTENARKWSAGFEFIREQTFGVSPAFNFTITLGKAPLVITTHNAWGKIHVNMDMSGVTSTGGLAFGGGWAVTGDAANDRFTLGLYDSRSPELSLLTGDAVSIQGTLPPELSSSVTYFAIRNGSLVQLATTKQRALDGIAIPFSTNGSSLIIARSLIATNRRSTPSSIPWAEPQHHSRRFQGTTVGNILGTATAHPFAVGDALILEGDDLPEPLVSGNVYYVATVPSRYGITVASTIGGSTITLTDDGSPNQIMRGKAYSEARQFIPSGTTNMVIATRDDDTISFTLVGVGTIIFYARNLDEVLGAQGEEMGFYWQTPTGIVSGLTYPTIYSLVSAWIDAPAIQRRKLEVHYASLLSLMTSSAGRLSSKLEITPQNTTRDTTANSTFLALDWGISMDSTQQIQTAMEAAGKRRRQRRWLLSGGMVVFPGFSDNDATAVAELSMRDSIIAAPINATADGTMRDFHVVGISEVTLPGDTEVYEFGGNSTGAGSKQFEIYTVWGTLILSAVDFAALSGQFTIRLVRKIFSGSTNSEVWHATLIVGGTVVTTKRTVTAWPHPGATNKTMTLRALCAVGSSITLDYVRRTVSLFPDVFGPSATAFSPTDGAAGVAVGSNLVLTFNKPIAFGAGRFRIRNLTDLISGQPTETVIELPHPTQSSIATAAAQTAIAYNALTINPAADLLAGKQYAIRIDAGALVDFSGNPHVGIDNDTTWNFST